MPELYVYAVGSDRSGEYSQCGACGAKTRDANLINLHRCASCGRDHDKAMALFQLEASADPEVAYTKQKRRRTPKLMED